jgi:hypothetical protein
LVCAGAQLNAKRLTPPSSKITGITLEWFILSPPMYSLLKNRDVPPYYASRLLSIDEDLCLNGNGE